MLVVSDTSPLNYLILIKSVDVLPSLYGRVAAPRMVLRELLDPEAPPPVRDWAARPPSWLVGLIDLASALTSLRTSTTFHAPNALFDQLLRNFANPKGPA